MSVCEQRGWMVAYVIACKTPDLARRACYGGDCGEEEQDQEEGHEHAGTGVGAGYVVDDAYDWIGRVLVSVQYRFPFSHEYLLHVRSPQTSQHPRYKSKRR